MGKDVARGARGSNAFLANFDTQIRTDYIEDTHALSVWVHRHRDYDRPRQTWTFEGRALAGALAFSPTTAEQQKVLTDEGDQSAPRKIGRGLKELGAFGEAHAVTSNVLASQIAGGLQEGQPADDHLAD